MAFWLILASFPVINTLWWWWADRRVRGVARARLWRAMIAAYVLAMLGLLAWLIGSRLAGSRADIPTPLLAGLYLWHMVILPVSVLAAGAGEAVAGLVRLLDPPAIPPAADRPSRRQFLSAAAAAVPPLLTAGAAGWSLHHMAEFRVRDLPVDLVDLPPELDGVVIAHVSDVHVGRFTPPAKLRAVADAVNDLRPDLVLMTGDLIDYDLADLPAGLEMIRRMRPRHGVFACEGNHDLFQSRAGFEQTVRCSGVPLLINESAMVRINGQDVQILGLRWGGWGGRRDAMVATNMVDVVGLLRTGTFAILLAHHPHAFDHAAQAGIPLTLSGHTHGGQVMLTSHIGPGPLMFKYWSGLYRAGRSALVVSNGVGNWFPLRINAPAEIVKITLRRM